MALNDLLKTATRGERGDSVYVGIKVKVDPDYAELCNRLGIPATSGGSTAFKRMLEIVLEHTEG